MLVLLVIPVRGNVHKSKYIIKLY